MTWRRVAHGLAFRLRRCSRARLRPNARPYAYAGAAHSARRLRSFPSLRSSDVGGAGLRDQQIKDIDVVWLAVRDVDKD